MSRQYEFAAFENESVHAHANLVVLCRLYGEFRYLWVKSRCASVVITQRAQFEINFETEPLTDSL